MSTKVEKYDIHFLLSTFFQTKSRWKSTFVANNADLYLLNEYNNERTHNEKQWNNEKSEVEGFSKGVVKLITKSKSFQIKNYIKKGPRFVKLIGI